MNIREAKEEIKKTVQAYTARTEDGTYRIPVQRQRPVLLIGPPGIGKTAIMEQIARECSLGFVAYTMTHHTRQSAIGLPVLEQKTLQGREYTVTCYTMSEIIASVYEQMEQSGRKEGILFLDEINCVSETLMPAMLQFLQYKTFGSHRLPEGWVIVAAGNPSAYNRTVREFDTVTLDRIKKMEIEPDFPVWKSYAVKRKIHPAVLSFLELKPKCFYVYDSRKKGFVTGRAWEDLSEMLLVLEELSLTVEDILFPQYLQEEETAREFTGYYRLYEKWKGKLQPERILDGDDCDADLNLPKLPFDERLCILWLLLQKLHGDAERNREQEKLADSLSYFVEGLEHAGAFTLDDAALAAACTEQLSKRKQGIQVKKDCGLLEPKEEEHEKQLEALLHSCLDRFRLSQDRTVWKSCASKWQEKTRLEKLSLSRALQNTISFVRKNFGEGYELLIFLTGLMENPGTAALMRSCLPEEYETALRLLSPHFTA
jgi:hypothetical protein